MGCQTPLEAFNRLNSAFEGADWPTVIALLDPADVLSFRDRELAVLTDRTEAVLDARSAGRPMQGFASRAILDPERLARLGSEPQEAFPGGATLSDLAALSPVDFLATCMEAGLAAARRLRDRAKERGFRDEAGDFSSPDRRVIGVLPEGTILAHVLYRWEGAKADPHPTRVDMRTVRLIDGEWRVCMDNELYMRVSPMLAFHAFDDFSSSHEQ
jgi:hypothetical protein